MGTQQPGPRSGILRGQDQALHKAHKNTARFPPLLLITGRSLPNCPRRKLLPGAYRHLPSVGCGISPEAHHLCPPRCIRTASPPPCFLLGKNRISAPWKKRESNSVSSTSWGQQPHTHSSCAVPSFLISMFPSCHELQMNKTTPDQCRGPGFVGFSAQFLHLGRAAG